MTAEAFFEKQGIYPPVWEALCKEETPWGILSKIPELLSKVGTWGEKTGLFIQREPGIWVGRDAEISRAATLIAPLVVGGGCVIRPGAYLRGNVILGEACVIGNSTEVKNAILFGGCKAPHFNYIGDSVLGARSHLGAGVIVSNVRLDQKEVTAYWESRVATGLKKAGALIGDGAEIGCHTVINPGTAVGRGIRVPPLSSLRGMVRQ